MLPFNNQTHFSSESFGSQMSSSRLQNTNPPVSNHYSYSIVQHVPYNEQTIQNPNVPPEIQGPQLQQNFVQSSTGYQPGYQVYQNFQNYEGVQQAGIAHNSNFVQSPTGYQQGHQLHQNFHNYEGVQQAGISHYLNYAQQNVQQVHNVQGMGAMGCYQTAPQNYTYVNGPQLNIHGPSYVNMTFPAPASPQGPPVKRKRTTYHPKQILALENAYIINQYIERNARMELARSLGLEDRCVKTWFQNRRMKDKMQKSSRTSSSEVSEQPAEDASSTDANEVHLPMFSADDVDSVLPSASSFVEPEPVDESLSGMGSTLLQ